MRVSVPEARWRGFTVVQGQRANGNGGSGDDGDGTVGRSIPGEAVAVFAAYLEKMQPLKPGQQEGMVVLGVPFDQIPNVYGLLREPGVVFEVTMRRVAIEDLPGDGQW